MASSNNDENMINISETAIAINDEKNADAIDDENDGGDDIVVKNLCVKCNVDMGDGNPRQLCGKTHCLQSDNGNSNYDNDDDEEPSKKKKKKKKKQNSSTSAVTSSSSSFPTFEEFTEEVKKVKPTKWIDLDRTKIFRIVRIEEVEIDETDGTKRIASVAVLEDSTGVDIKVWLPGIIAKELSRIDVSELDTYIRSLGPKISVKSGRTYQNFEIIKL